MEQVRKARVANLPTAYLRLMTDLLRKKNIDFVAACRARKLDLAKYLNSFDGLPRSFHLDIERCFVELTGNRPDIWFKLGLQLRLPTHGPLALAALTAPTVHHTLLMNEEFHGIVFSLAQIHTIDVGDEVGVRWAFEDVPVDIRNFTLVRDLAASSAFINDLWTGKFPFSHLILTPEFEHLIDITRQLDTPTTISDSGPCLLWSREDSAKTLFNGDIDLHNHYLQECYKLLAGSVFSDPFLNDASKNIEKGLLACPEDVSLEYLSKVMHISERTLQRRLADHHMSFRKVCDATRLKVALALLNNPKISFGDISFRLGYSEPASFYHAFRRWTGKSPNEYQREHLFASRTLDDLPESETVPCSMRWHRVRTTRA